jgi:hypothetical protein
MKLKINFYTKILLLLLTSYTVNLFADDTLPYGDLTPETERDEFNYDDSGDTPWKEDLLKNLSPPRQENLVELNIDHPPIGFKVYIDTTSITVSEKDSVVRYWLVLKAGKSRNTMYEGIKCNTSQYKTYAYENKWKKGKVNVSKAAKWQLIEAGGHNHFRFELEKYFFCSDVLPRPVEDILDIIAGYKSTTSDYDPTFHYVQ